MAGIQRTLTGEARLPLTSVGTTGADMMSQCIEAGFPRLRRGGKCPQLILYLVSLFLVRKFDFGLGLLIPILKPSCFFVHRPERPEPYRQFMLRLSDDITPEESQNEYQLYLADFFGSAIAAEFDQKKNKPE